MLKYLLWAGTKSALQPGSRGDGCFFAGEGVKPVLGCRRCCWGSGELNVLVEDETEAYGESKGERVMLVDRQGGGSGAPAVQRRLPEIAHVQSEAKPDAPPECARLECGASSAELLEQLGMTVWWSVYRRIRRRGWGAEDAQDLAQEFFLHVLSNGRLDRVCPEVAKLRGFLKVSLQHFLVNAWNKLHAWKRGGDWQAISWDSVEHSRQVVPEAGEEGNVPPWRLDQAWAGEVVARVVEGLRKEYTTAGRGALFEVLESLMAERVNHGRYTAVAIALHMHEGAVRVALHRFRRRFGQLLRLELEARADSDEAPNEEIRALFTAWATCSE